MLVKTVFLYDIPQQSTDGGVVIPPTPVLTVHAEVLFLELLSDAEKTALDLGTLLYVVDRPLRFEVGTPLVEIRDALVAAWNDRKPAKQDAEELRWQFTGRRITP